MSNKNINRLFRFFVIVLLGSFICSNVIFAQSFSTQNKGLHFTSLPTRWDEAIPLGNGMLGASVYEKDGNLRIALDRADLWDLRPIKSYTDPDFSYKWIYKQVLKGDYRPVKKFLDAPDIQGVAPTKIPAGALEFPIKDFGKVASIDLDITTATCHIRWVNGTAATIFISAKELMGYFRFENLPVVSANESTFQPQLKSPLYQNSKYEDSGSDASMKQDLALLDYPEGIIKQLSHRILYHQQGWNDFSYDIAVNWKHRNLRTLEGKWNITSKGSPYSISKEISGMVTNAFENTFDQAWTKHKKWWKSYWEKSSIKIPDSILMHQYDMGMYLFASASRKGAPPISLQAVWTADNGSFPPWRGDFHNDLNTQLSYWAGYASNHLTESAVFTDWLWKIRSTAKEYTRQFFKGNGLNVPGVTTLAGQPMGRWAQYSFSPTVSCWLAQNFYWQWIYSGDRHFLEQFAYPWVKETATHIQNIAVKDENGQWKLPISSSPEFYDGTLSAWYLRTSNFDLSLIRWLLQTATQMADTLHLQNEAVHWDRFLSGWPQLSVGTRDSALLVAPGIPYSFSHRHFSHLMSIYPLQTVDWFQGDKEKRIINASLDELDKYGPSAWCGYSYTWEACLRAMSQNGEGAAKALRIFATAFCSPNGFHLNGDQTGKGYSDFTYRPFTLEGNFAFAQGVQLMLLQQHDGINYVFPAIPPQWENVSFKNLRTPGGFLISGKKKDGKIAELKIQSLNGGTIKIKNPFPGKKIKVTGANISSSAFDQDIISLFLSKGQIIKIEN